MFKARTRFVKQWFISTHPTEIITWLASYTRANLSLVLFVGTEAEKL
jgi:hypothetical protein